MKKDIFKKLKNTLTTPISDEHQVVYILVEIRKILEHLKEYKLRDSYPLLKFYCDWALHIKIDRSNSAKKIIQELDKAIEDLGSETEDDDSFVIRVSKIISFKDFREQLGSLLLTSNLPNDITAENKLWNNFVEIFSDVIADCPLKTKDNLIHVEEFSITKKHQKNSFSWQIKLKKEDGVSVTLTGSL